VCHHSVAVGETQAPASKILKTSLNDFEDGNQALAVPVDELVTYMSLRIPADTPESKMSLLVAGEQQVLPNCFWLPRHCCAFQCPVHRVSEYYALLELQSPDVALPFALLPGHRG